MPLSDNHDSFWAGHLDKVGAGGTIVALLCCPGLPALQAVVSAIDPGFLIDDAILVPLPVPFLLIALAGLCLGTRRHGPWWARVLGVASGLLMFAAGANTPEHGAGQRRRRRTDSDNRVQRVATDPADSATQSPARDAQAFLQDGHTEKRARRPADAGPQHVPGTCHLLVPGMDQPWLL